MKPREADATIRALLVTRAKLVRQSDRLARGAADAAGAGDRQGAIQIALDADPLLNEADSLLPAATIIMRQRKAAAAAKR